MSDKQKIVPTDTTNNKNHEKKTEQQQAQAQCTTFDDPIVTLLNMSDEELQLIQGILQNPKDTFAKLVFADWLEERGRESEALTWRSLTETDLDRVRFWSSYIIPLRKDFLGKMTPMEY